MLPFKGWTAIKNGKAPWGKCCPSKKKAVQQLLENPAKKEAKQKGVEWKENAAKFYHK